MRFAFDLSSLGQQKVFCVSYEIPVSVEPFSRFMMHEGAGFRGFSTVGIVSQPRVMPYGDRAPPGARA